MSPRRFTWFLLWVCSNDVAISSLNRKRFCSLVKILSPIRQQKSFMFPVSCSKFCSGYVGIELFFLDAKFPVKWRTFWHLGTYFTKIHTFFPDFCCQFLFITQNWKKSLRVRGFGLGWVGNQETYNFFFLA